MKYLAAVCLLFISGKALAHHGKGGALSYEYLGAGSQANTSKYKVTVQHYINCSREGDEPQSVYLGIFDAGTNSLLNTVTISRSSSQEINKTTFNSCINPKPSVCLFLVTYVTTVELANNTAGYILSEQDCCRADDILNISSPSTTGFSNYNTIPGVIDGVVYRNNSSPALVLKDTAVICHNSYFQIDFGATDADGDKLSYSFCAAKATGSATRQPDPPSAPPYSDVTYTSGYSAASPLGSSVTINNTTGLISGTAPATTGAYAITVCITETRNGVDIGSTKKEVLVTVADCSLTAAALQPTYTNCDDFTFNFQNESSASNINSYYWDFGVAGTTKDTSTQATPQYTYADTGTYTLKLKVSSAAGCEDSTTATIKVYPGFHPGFTVSGDCYQTPFLFNDTSTTKYGYINSRLWDFGDETTTADTSSLKSPSYLYSTTGTKTVTFIVTSNKGCSATITKPVEVKDQPSLTPGFTDTLICSIDTLTLNATGTGNFSWSPNYNIIGANTSSPKVYPKDTTTYIVTLSRNGCVAKDSVTVNVLDSVTVSLPADTTICKTDTIQLSPQSDALQYQWLPAESLNNAFIKYPLASPNANTTYNVKASLGKCYATGSIKVTVVPYPVVAATSDTTICYNTAAQLNATTDAPYFVWSPANSLVNSNTLHPTAAPTQTTTYTITVRDTLGCPKPVTDVVAVTVIPKVQAFAGNDTTVIINQPLQFNATGGVNYLWTPATSLSDPHIANPVGIYNASQDSVTYTVKVSTREGCYDYDNITVRIFKTAAYIFVPTAFTPGSDGLNDIIKAIPVGLKTFQYFKIFNRWGQMVFSTTQPNVGWDGTINGALQPTGTFVFMAAGITYLNQPIFKKGTLVLIR